jgi:hypothetical protein
VGQGHENVAPSLRADGEAVNRGAVWRGSGRIVAVSYIARDSSSAQFKFCLTRQIRVRAHTAGAPSRARNPIKRCSQNNVLEISFIAQVALYGGHGVQQAPAVNYRQQSMPFRWADDLSLSR